MNKVIKLGAIITLSAITLAGCGNSLATAPNSTTISNQAFSTNANPGAKGPGGDRGKFGPGMKGDFGFAGFSVDLKLTDDQKKQLEALKPAKPAAPTADDKTKMDSSRTAMEAVRKEINDAFISDTFDATALQAKLDALKPAKPDNKVDHITEEATRLVKTYNILTPEQRTLLETKLAEMANKTPKVMPSPNANFDPAKMADSMFDKLATNLGLTDDQKTRLKAAMQPPTDVAKPDFAAMEAKKKASQDAITSALKAGNATVESIAAILKANEPTEIKHEQPNELDHLAKIHDILNADQRKKFIESNKGPGFGPGNNMGPKGPGFGPGGHDGHGPQGPGKPQIPAKK